MNSLEAAVAVCRFLFTLLWSAWFDRTPA